MKFIVELLFAELIFLFPVDRRSRFGLRLAAIALLCAAGFFLFPAYALECAAQGHVLRQFAGFLGLFALTVVAMGFLFDVPFSSLFSLCVAGYAVEHIAYHVTKLVENAAAALTGEAVPFPADPEFFVFPVVYLIVFLSLGLFAARSECWKKWDMRFNLLSIALVFICVGLTRVAVAFDAEDFIPVNVYAITSCVMALVVQFALYRLVDLKAENTAVHLLWQEERKQYELSKKTIDTINIKYHDLKHKLRGMNLPSEEVESIKDAVRVYGSRIRTGNEILDVLLTENSLRCSEQGITLTYTGNGADFGFMQAMDIYSLFGNAVSNAVEAVEKLADPEKRVIDISSERVGDMVNVRVCNYFDGGLLMKDGIPQTSKVEEEGFHGFGMKSMAMIAEKYGGGLSVSTDADLFTLSIYLLQE